MSDMVYRFTGSLWGKKMLVHFLGIMAGIFIIVVGVEDSRSEATMFGLMTGLAFFTESANGSCFSLVPHVQPTANGECLPANIMRFRTSDLS